MIIYEQTQLNTYNTFGVAGTAKQLIIIESVADVPELLDRTNHNIVDFFVLGCGSNVLFVDDFDGSLLHIKIPGITVVEDSKDDVVLRVGAGVIWNDLVNYCVDQNWYGIENLALIPGTVGAAPVQNIGAYGAELSDVFTSLEAWDLSAGKLENFDKKQSRFGYRSSIFKSNNKHLITSINIRLSKHHSLNTSYGAIETVLAEKGIMNPTLADVRDSVVTIRQSKLPDPNKIGNAGSFFKNPILEKLFSEELRKKYPKLPFYPAEDGKVKISAAWLIDQCGWKGKRIGNCGVYEKHALILVNYGGAAGRDIYNLSKNIQSSVLDKFGVEILPEVNIIKG